MDSSIINFLSTYEFPAIFWGSFILGETVVIAAAFLAGQGVWSIKAVFWLLLAGTLVSDLVWFVFGQKFFGSSKWWAEYGEKYKSFLLKLENLTGKRPYLSLLFIKFFYGVRILTILYLSMRKVSLLVFFLFNTLGTTVWLVVVVFIGWFVGRGVASVANIFQNVEYVLVVLVFFVIFFRVITVWFGKQTTRK